MLTIALTVERPLLVAAVISPSLSDHRLEGSSSTCTFLYKY